MILRQAGERLEAIETDRPRASAHDVVVRVEACGVCRTEFHLVDGELPDPSLPVIPGHQVVGIVEEVGAAVGDLRAGDRVGIPWLGSTCRECGYCASGRENLCARARFTGCHLDGGFAEYAAADSRYVFRIPRRYDSIHAAPLLCAGLIGYRSLRMTGDAQRLGLYGFGAAAHLVAQIALHQGRQVFAFTRAGDREGQSFARSLGTHWAGGSDEAPPHPLDAAIIFAPVGALVPAALAATARGSTVVCAGIHMSDIPSFPYSLLWGERVLRSVANLTRRDGEEFFDLAAEIGIEPRVAAYPLRRAQDALDDLRAGRFEGAAVVVP